MAEVARTVLGPYMSAECFRYLRYGTEETAGRGPIVMAGKQRGLSLEDYLKGLDPADTAGITATLNKLLGKDGTRLCIVEEVQKTPRGYTVRISESACSTGVKASEPNCAFTLGVFVGALEVVSKKRLTATETECVATGQPNCVYQLEEL